MLPRSVGNASESCLCGSGSFVGPAVLRSSVRTLDFPECMSRHWRDGGLHKQPEGRCQRKFFRPKYARDLLGSGSYQCLAVLESSIAIGFEFGSWG